jgi:hypothetical protein
VYYADEPGFEALTVDPAKQAAPWGDLERLWKSKN